MPVIATQTAQKHEIYSKRTIGLVKPHRISAKRTIEANADMHTAVPATQNSGKRTNGWTDERRRKQAAAIRRWQPWAQSTGPRTAAGKATSRLNATKHGGRSAAARRFLKDLVRWRAFRRLAVRAVEQNLHPDDLAIVLRHIHAATLARSAERIAQYQEHQVYQDHGTLGGLGVNPYLLPAAQPGGPSLKHPAIQCDSPLPPAPLWLRSGVRERETYICAASSGF